MTYRCDRVMFQPSQMTAPPPSVLPQYAFNQPQAKQGVQNNQDKNKHTRSSRMATRSYESYVGAVRQCCARRCQGLTDIII